MELTPLLSDSEKRLLTSDVERLLATADRNLGVAEKMNLSPAQQERLRQARTFCAQARETSGRDLPAAKSLAERASILSREILAAK
jgi:hypothetical protein